jgi:hypothetical protein
MVGQLESSSGLVPSPPGDIWSLACLLLHMVTGQAPWHGLPVLQICKRVRGGAAAALPAAAAPLTLALAVQHAPACETCNSADCIASLPRLPQHSNHSLPAV